MIVRFQHGELRIDHKTSMGDVSDLFYIGNQYRKAKGLQDVTFQTWRVSPRTAEFAAVVSEHIGRPAFETSKGRGKRTKAHLYMLLDAATYLDPTFKLEVYETFVKGRMLEWRDDSGDDFLRMNAALDHCSEQVLGKPAHTGNYVTLAKILRKSILGVEHPGWNNATGEQLRARDTAERYLTRLIEDGLVRDWDHLKELAGKA